MKQKFFPIEIVTEGINLYEITDKVTTIVAESGFKNALLNVSVLHTSCSLLIQENASPDVQIDLINFFKKIAPMGSAAYQHNIEGIDDMPAHLKTALTQTNLTLSINNFKVILGKWQGIFLFEHKLAHHVRKIVIHIIGDMT